MTIPHLKRSRIVKTLTDRADSIDYEIAEARFSGVRLAMVVSPDAARTAAGQAATLTAVATAMKCFERVALVGDLAVSLRYIVPLGEAIDSAARTLGAEICPDMPHDATHVVFIGAGSKVPVFAVRCWWDRWAGGSIPHWDNQPLGESINPLAGSLAGAIAIREVFATVLGDARAGMRPAVSSLWEPWNEVKAADRGPTSFYLPNKLWFIGLGHLGQGALWNLGLLPGHGELAILQDDQTADVENEATGLLTSSKVVGQRKTRIAADWVEAKGWVTALIERRHHGDTKLCDGDPPIVITGLDSPNPRLAIARNGYDYMIDAGVGHGPRDFEALQIRVLRKGDDATKFWGGPPAPKQVAEILKLNAYKRLADKHDACGTFTLAQASTAVPFVGAAVGALVITQAIRLACMLGTVRMMQMELGSPEMVTAGDLISGPGTNVGGILISL
jgi:hypothetical protein